jgi:hypothetical protein
MLIEVPRARAANVEKYDISDEDAFAIQVPTVMSVEYLQRLVRSRNTSLKLYRAVLLAEKARRAGEEPRDLGLDKRSVLRSRDVVMPMPHTPLKYGLDTDKYVFDIREAE